MIRILILGEQSPNINRTTANQILWRATWEILMRSQETQPTIGCLAEDTGINGLAYWMAKVRKFHLETLSLTSDRIEKELIGDQVVRLETEEELKNYLMGFDALIRIGGGELHRSYCREFLSRHGESMVIQEELG